MPEPEPSPADRLKQELARLAADLKAMGVLRYQLARLELDAAVNQLRRLALLLGIAMVALTVALALGAVVLCELMGIWLGWSRLGWLGVLGTVLGACGLLVAWLAWRRFRLRFTAFQDTLEELREDVAWIREWLGGK